MNIGNRRAARLFTAATVAGLLGLGGAAQATAWPEKSVTLVVTASPGGTTDVVARLLAQPLAVALGQPVVIDNKPGAAGAVAATTVMRAPADGYTLMVNNSGYQVIAPQMTEGASWDPTKDFTSVAHVLTAPQIILVRSSLPVKSLAELAAYAKANAGKLNYASSGYGSPQQMSAEMLKQQLGIEATHVPYKGTGPALTDLLGDRVDMLITSPAPVLPHIATGRLRALAVTGTERLASLPDVPTVIEAGLPNMQASTWFAVYGPAGLPAAVTDRLTKEIAAIVKSKEYTAAVAAQEAKPDYMSPADLDKLTQQEVVRWKAVIEKGGLKSKG